jgi:hypothetical protein
MIMRISRENYEAWFLDYIEGKLNSSETEILLDFLSANTDLKAELESFETVSIAPANSIFPNKEILKKNVGNITAVTDLNFDELCIGKVEGTLDSEKEALLLAYLQQHPEKKKEFKAYQKAIIKPDLNIVFENKRNLKHFKLDRRIVFRTATSIAASLLFLVMLYFYYSEDEIKNNTASINTESIKKPEKIIPGKIEEITIPKSIISKNVVPVRKKLKKEITTPAKENIEPVQKEIESLAFMQTENIYSIENYTSSEIIKDYKPINENLAVISPDQTEIQPKKKFDIWALAQLGADGINNLVGSRIVIVKTEEIGNNR